MEFSSEKPIYIQIKEYYERLIDHGVLKDGDEMPSVREVAIEHRINPNTVQRAFSLMVDDGYLSNIPKKGFYVCTTKKNKTELVKAALKNLLSIGVSKKEIIKELEGIDDD